jgi:hypothetical protein
MMLLDEGVSPETASAIKAACIAATDSLVASARKVESPRSAAD